MDIAEEFLEQKFRKNKRVNLKISMSDELYAQIKHYKTTHKVSLSALARDFMKKELNELESIEREITK